MVRLSLQVSMVKIRLRGPVVSDYISEGVVQVEHEGKKALNVQLDTET